MTSTRPLARIWPKSSHIDAGVLEWLATKVDPGGNPAFHGRALHALASAAIKHRRIERQDGAQEALLWIHRHGHEFESWSAEDKSTGFLRRAFHNKITDAVRSERGDRRTTVDGRRRRVYPPDEIPWSQLAHGDVEAADRILTRWQRNSPGPEELVLGDADADGDNRCGTQRGALHSISEAERELLYRRHVDKAPIRELAAELGISLTAVEKRLGRARRRVHREFNEQVSGSGPKGPPLF